MRYERPRFHRASCPVWPRRYGPDLAAASHRARPRIRTSGEEHLIDCCSRETACNDPTGGSSGRRRCRFPGRLGANSPAAVVRMPSTAMTPIAMLARSRIHIRCGTLSRRRPLVTRLGHRQILRHCNGRQCADDQGAVYKSNTHACLRMLLQIECRCYPSTSSDLLARQIVPRRASRADHPAAQATPLSSK